MTHPPADCLLDLREQFTLDFKADDRQWEYFKSSPETAVILPVGRPPVLFRGQGTRYSPSFTALARRLGPAQGGPIAQLDLLGQAKVAERIIRRIWFTKELENHPAALWLTEQKLERFDHALAQHYGIPTGYMDLSESFDVSCFFATCYLDNAGAWNPCAEGSGVMYMLPIERLPIRPDALQPIGLQILPRPREQFGWVIVCGINCDFEDIPGLQMLEFKHNEAIGRHFLQMFSHGLDLFPPDSMSTVADSIMASAALPAALTESVVRDLCGQDGGFTGKSSEIIATMVNESGLSFTCDIKVFDDHLQARAKQEWDARREDFFRKVGFRLVRSRRVSDA